MRDKNYVLGCGALIVNDNEEVLLIKRKGTSTFDNVWSIPGGAVRWGEELEDAVRREVNEEIGVDIDIVNFLEYTQDIRPDRHGIYFGFLARIRNGKPKNLELQKCKELRWFPVRKVPTDTAEYTMNAIKAYLGKPCALHNPSGFSPQ